MLQASNMTTAKTSYCCPKPNPLELGYLVNGDYLTQMELVNLACGPTCKQKEPSNVGGAAPMGDALMHESGRVLMEQRRFKSLSDNLGVRRFFYLGILAWFI